MLKLYWPLSPEVCVCLTWSRKTQISLTQMHRVGLHMHFILIPGDTLRLCVLRVCATVTAWLCVRQSIFICKHKWLFKLPSVCRSVCAYSTVSFRHAHWIIQVFLSCCHGCLRNGCLGHTHTHTPIWACWQMWTPPYTLQRRQRKRHYEFALPLFTSPLHFTLLLLLNPLLLTSLARVPCCYNTMGRLWKNVTGFLE